MISEPPFRRVGARRAFWHGRTGAGVAGNSDADDENGDAGHDCPRVDAAQAIVEPLDRRPEEDERDRAWQGPECCGEKERGPPDPKGSTGVVDEVIWHEEESHDEDRFEAVGSHAIAPSGDEAGLLVVHRIIGLPGEAPPDSVGEHRRRVGGDDHDEYADKRPEQQPGGDRRHARREQQDGPQDIGEGEGGDAPPGTVDRFDEPLRRLDRREIFGALEPLPRSEGAGPDGDDEDSLRPHTHVDAPSPKTRAAQRVRSATVTTTAIAMTDHTIVAADGKARTIVKKMIVSVPSTRPRGSVVLVG